MSPVVATALLIVSRARRHPVIPEIDLTQYQLTASAVEAIGSGEDPGATAHRLSYVGAIISQFLTTTTVDGQPAYNAMRASNTEVLPPDPVTDELSDRMYNYPLDMSVNAALGPYMLQSGLDTYHALSHLMVLGARTHAVCLGGVHTQLIVRCIQVPLAPTVLTRAG